jgi:N-acetylmuramoyl-L-alanine amidase
MRTVAVVVGHSRSAQGAVAVDGTSEWRWNGVLAADLSAKLAAIGYHAPVILRPETGTYSSQMAHVAEQVGAASCAVELHFNSIDVSGLPPEKLPRRTTALHWPGSTRGAELAQGLAEDMAVAIGGPKRPRSARAQSTSWAGAPLLFLRETRCPAVICEPHFGCTADDHAASTAARDTGRLAQAMAVAIDAFLRGAA